MYDPVYDDAMGAVPPARGLLCLLVVGSSVKLVSVTLTLKIRQMSSNTKIIEF